MNLRDNSLDLAVKDKNQSGSDSAEGVGAGTLEHGTHALILHDLGEAIGGTLVQPLGLGLLGLHLKATTDGIERVRSIASNDGSALGDGELGKNADHVGVLTVRVHAVEGIEQTEVYSSVGDDTGDGHTETVVETQKAGRALGGLHEAITKAVEGLLGGADIGGKTGTGIIERVDNAQRTGTSKTTGSHVDGEVHAEVGLGVVLGEQHLDGILEGEVESLGGEISDHVGEVTSPESLDALLGSHTGEAITDASVSLDLTGADHGVGVLGLDDEFHALDRGGGGLGDGAGDTTGGEVGGKGLHGGGFLLLGGHIKLVKCNNF
jgi:hypothetical protein